MAFSSVIFIFGFLPLTLMVYYLLDRRFKNYLLLLTSLLFYSWGEPKFVLVMIGSVLVNYLAALLIGRCAASEKKRRAKAILTFDVLFNLAVFFVFKYLNFTISNLNLLGTALGLDGLPIAQTSILLPIGLSFFTFQAMSYVFDVYYHKGEVQKNPLNVLLYVSLFPQLVAGPIVRYQTVADEIQTRRETLSDFKRGIQRFLIGLSKKVILANAIAVAADAAFAALGKGMLTAGYAWLGALAFGLQIYFDFSGYSDMAIGLGLMFGFHFLENFDHPYLSKTVSEFWRRWHISLGSWFRDYVYIPLGGSRVSKGRLVFNLFAVWALTGIWHGANWTFLCWGLMYFILLTFENLTGIEKKLSGRRGASILYRAFTILCVLCGWVLFRADSLSDGARFLASMFGFASGGRLWSNLTGWMWGQYAVIITLAIILCVDWKTIFEQRLPRYMYEHKWTSVVYDVILLVLFVVSMSYVVSGAYNPFIYFNF